MAAKSRATASDLDAIQGLWRLVSYIARGAPVHSSATHYQFEGSRVKEITPSLVDGGMWATFELDADEWPKQLTTTYEWPTEGGQAVTRVNREAYDLDGDTLRICRPNVWGEYPDTISDKDHTVVTLHRDSGPPPATKQRSGKQPIDDPVLGKLTWNDNFDEWDGRVVLHPELEVVCHFTPSGGQDEQIVTAGRDFIAWLRTNEPAARRYAASELLDTHNDCWNDDDPISAETFADRMTLETAAIRPDGAAGLYYRDGNLFWGHCIIVSVNADRGFKDATIAG